MLNNPINWIDPYGLFSIKDAVGKIIGDSPGDIFTIGASYGFAYYLGVGFSFDRVVMPNGEADWFFTPGGGLSTQGFSPTIDRGKIRNVDNDPCNLKKEFIEGLSISSDISLGFFGAEVAASNFLDKSENELGTLKGGLRTKPGMNLFGNWTLDIGN